jgi:hypothetical protein
MPTTNSLGPLLLAAVGLLSAAGAGSCDASSSRSAEASSAGSEAHGAGAPTDAERAATAAADAAADELYPLLEKLAALVAHAKADGGGLDCAALAPKLSQFAQAGAAAMAEIRKRGGGKIAVERALQRKHRERYAALFDPILEALEVECASDPAVSAAARKIDL